MKNMKIWTIWWPNINPMFPLILIPLIPDQRHEAFDQVEGEILIQYFLIPLYSLYPLYQKEIWRFWQRSWQHNNLFFFLIPLYFIYSLYQMKKWRFEQFDGQIQFQYSLIPLYSLYPLYQKENLKIFDQVDSLILIR